MTLKSKVLSALGWSAGARFFGQLIRWVITFYVIRILTPQDYGLMSIATLFIGFLSQINEFGLGAAIIQGQNTDEQSLKQIFGFVLAINFILFLILFISAYPLAAFFRDGELVAIIQVLSIQFVITAFLTIPQSLLARDLDFKNKSIIDLVSNLLGGFFTLGLALKGSGVWALVYGSLAIVLVRTVGLNIYCPYFKLPVFCLKDMRQFVSFGGYITLERVLWYFYSQADIFIIGRLLGKELLGFYSVAKQISSLPLQKLSPILNSVAFPAFAQIQNNKNNVSTYTVKAIHAISFFSFPIFFGISATASEFVPIVLGEKWIPAILPIEIISLTLPLGMISGLMLSGLKGVGRADVSLKIIVVAFVLMPTAFLIGLKWGLLGISWAWAIAYPIYFFIMLFQSVPILSLRVSDILKAMSYPLLLSISMYVTITTFNLGLKENLLSVPRLLVLICTGLIVYNGLMLAFARKSFREVLALVRKS